MTKAGDPASFHGFMGVREGREQLFRKVTRSSWRYAPRITSYPGHPGERLILFMVSGCPRRGVKSCLKKTSGHLQRRKAIHLVIDRSWRENSKSSLYVAAPISGNMMSTVHGMNRETFTISPNGIRAGKGSLPLIFPVLPRSNAVLIPSGQL
jgi:hypothetical protein